MTHRNHPYFWGELRIVYINIVRGAKEPRNLQNHRGGNQPCFRDLHYIEVREIS